MDFDPNRKRLFDESAVDYDCFRPSYPEEVVRQISVGSELTPRSKLLEIGSGTGKATMLFAKQGLRIDCVEPGEHLARIAEANCANWPRVRVYITDFENFPFQPKSYDLVVAAQAFHWITPSMRMKLASSALKDGGHLALIYNYSPKPSDETLLNLSKLISRESMGRLDDSWDYATDILRWEDEIGRNERFENLSVSHFPWQRTVTAEQYVGVFRTYSDFLSLPGGTRQRLATAMTKFIKRNGGSVHLSYDCVLFHCRCAV